MGKTLQIFVLAFAAIPLAGCMSAEDERIEGINFSAANAIAHNNALQRIDPWPVGVQDTDIEVPADRGEAEQQAEGADGKKILTAAE
jgi:hypothetical protein